MDIKTIFSEIIKNKTNVKFNDNEIDSMANDFLSIAIIQIITAVEKKLNKDEFENVNKLLENKDLAGAIKYIEIKLGKSAIEELTEKEIRPLIDEYVNEVIKN